MDKPQKLKLEKKDTQEVMANPVQVSFASQMIDLAIKNQLSAEVINSLMAMRRELKAEQAKEDYDRAMAEFQRVCPEIPKIKEAKNNGVVMYHYAPLEVIVKYIKEPLASNGFSYDFETEMTNEHVKVFCTVKHFGGHRETKSVDIPLANKTGIMNAPQQSAATITYAKRYALKNILGIETGDDDTDAAGDADDKKKPTKEQLSKIADLSEKAGMTHAALVAKFKEKYGVSYGMMNALQAEGVIMGLEAKINAKS